MFNQFYLLYTLLVSNILIFIPIKLEIRSNLRNSNSFIIDLPRYYIVSFNYQAEISLIIIKCLR